MIAFVAATPLQIFNCLSIAYDKKEKFDLYIMDFAVKDIEDYSNAIADCEYVNKIIKCPSFYSVKGKKSIIKDFLLTSTDFISNESYSCLYITYVGDRSSIFYNKMIKNNPNLDVHFYEEGISVYLSGSVNFAESNRRKVLNKLMGIKSVNEHISSLFVYKQALLNNNTQVELKKIYPIEGLKRDYLKKYYKVDSKIYKKYKFIFFDQYFYYDEKDEKYPLFKNYDKNIMVNDVFKGVNKDEVLIKMHPVHHADEYSSSEFKVDYSEGKIWESIILDLGDSLNKKVFVTLFSTAVFSPKIMFNLEPTIIIIGKALQNEYKKSNDEMISKWNSFFWNERIETFVENVKKIYNDPSKIICPSSLEEVQKILGDI